MPLTSDPLGHVGLTLAVALAVQFFCRGRTLHSRWSGRLVADARQLNKPEASPIDYRLVIVGALLPDLLDRGLGLLPLPEAIHPSGRMFAHTLLFAIALLVFSLLVLGFTGSRGALIVALASAGHLVIDRMWEAPKTLFWPIYGLRFEGAEFDLSPDWLRWTQTDTAQFLQDILGAVVLFLFVGRKCVRGTFVQWLKTGSA